MKFILNRRPGFAVSMAAGGVEINKVRQRIQLDAHETALLRMALNLKTGKST